VDGAAGLADEDGVGLGHGAATIEAESLGSLVRR
jgi:hypothetical protein